MSVLLTASFWVDAIERSIKTVAQVSAAMLTADGVIGILDVNWKVSLSVAGLAGVISILTSIGSAQITQTNSASIVPVRVIK